MKTWNKKQTNRQKRGKMWVTSNCLGLVLHAIGCMWLVAWKVGRVFHTKHRTKLHKTNAIFDYFPHSTENCYGALKGVELFLDTLLSIKGA